MASKTFTFAWTRTALAAALVVNATTSMAQDTVTITGSRTATIAGFGDTAPARTPIQTLSLGQSALADQGVLTLNALPRLDASVGDAYNAEGYWSIVSVRGFTLDNRFNYRRDGLPINAETAIALENKDRLEILKGTSGAQAGTSAPGGLVNLGVKRPQGDTRQASLAWRESGSVLAAVDLGQSFGPDRNLAVRLNVAAEHLNPVVRNTKGNRSLFALAADWRLGADSLLQAEIESSRQKQPSVAGFSLLGNSVPAASSVDVRRNLNDQPWRQPVVMNGDTASLKWQQRLSADWRFTLHGMQQRLKSDDRTAFPYGVYDANTYDCPSWCDRFAPDGSFTYWEFISNNERRTTTAVQAQLSGRVNTGAIEHQVETGVLSTRYKARFEDQIFDIAGTGSVFGTPVTPPSPGFPDANTNRDERSTELFVRDAMKLGDQWQLWAGLRHTQMDRAAERTSVDSNNSLRATNFSRQATTPWLAVTAQLTPKSMLYASWGKGLETDVAPNRSRYSNAGDSLALASRQIEVGLKHGSDQVEAALTLFDIDRGVTADIGSCGGTNTCLRVVDGSARHRGVEGSLAQQFGIWSLQASAMLLDAERKGSSQAGINGQRPVNVPKATLRLGGEVRPAEGLAVQASVAAESNRVVLPYDESVQIPGWARLDLGARYRHTLGGTALTWRVGVDNATNRRAWKESPYQFGHVYLYPMSPRTWRVSLQAGF
jgi:iron complex outermembrane receptor protein